MTIMENETLPLGGVLDIYVERLRANAATVNALLPERVIPVLKGDAYGFGITACGPVFARKGFSRIAVGTTEDAVALRRAGVDTPLMITNGLGGECLDADLEWFVGEPEINRLAEQPAPVRVHVDVDFGVGRSGIRPRDLSEAVDVLRRGGAEVVGLAAQLPATAPQAVVSEAVGVLVAARRFCPDALLHLGGSDAIRWAPLVPEAAIRVGRLLYGVIPRGTSPSVANAIEPAWAWRATAQPYTAPDRIGYGREKPPSGMPIRIDAGFAHGVPMAAAGRWTVRAAGLPYMIHTVFMLSSIAYPVADDLPTADPVEVLLSGRSDHADVPIRSLADAIEAPTTAILTSPRVQRRVRT